MAGYQIAMARCLWTRKAFWKQKARLHWLQKGDSNTSFFQAMNQSRIAALQLEYIEDEHDRLLVGAEAIHEAAISCSQQLLSS